MKISIRSQRRSRQEELASNLELNNKMARHVEFAKEKGSSIWLSTLPLENNGFALHRSEFKDAVALKYGWTPERLPLKCACDTPFSVEHALSCPRGAFPTHRHNCSPWMGLSPGMQQPMWKIMLVWMSGLEDFGVPITKAHFLI